MTRVTNNKILCEIFSTENKGIDKRPLPLNIRGRYIDWGTMIDVFNISKRDSLVFNCEVDREEGYNHAIDVTCKVCYIMENYIKGINHRDAAMCIIAGMYHDIGKKGGRDKHPERGAKEFKDEAYKTLGLELNAEDIQLIAKIIEEHSAVMDTNDNNVNCLLSQIVADADTIEFTPMETFIRRGVKFMNRYKGNKVVDKDDIIGELKRVFEFFDMKGSSVVHMSISKKIMDNRERYKFDDETYSMMADILSVGEFSNSSTVWYENGKKKEYVKRYIVSSNKCTNLQISLYPEEVVIGKKTFKKHKEAIAYMYKTLTDMH